MPVRLCAAGERWRDGRVADRCPISGQDAKGVRRCGLPCLRRASLRAVCPTDALTPREGSGVRLHPELCIGCGNCRDAGPFGAVFGSKRRKGIVIAGNRTLSVADPAACRREYDALFRAAATSPAMKKYHNLGTPMNVFPLNESGALPRGISKRRSSRGPKRSPVRRWQTLPWAPTRLQPTARWPASTSPRSGVSSPRAVLSTRHPR